ncbi:adhesion G protein-coupled receptor F4 [Melanotaenia boesemani]|uniref:adhesion G protein-coupled receptor F4 n=1 Tax=Melanotaenia boesemani TaxID=1250792 RepID=UPI001C05625C|nr:adhesion G protein-coupled receptor F4 [Melanotaenia boesemani]
MWTFVFLFILGTKICQAAAEGNSTQMLYAHMTIDESVLKFMPNSSEFHFTDLSIEEFTITTECRNETNNKNCNCMEGYTWSEQVANSQSCSNKTFCTFPMNSSYTCVSITSVSIMGSITVDGSQYSDCLTDKASPAYMNCYNKLFVPMKTQFSFLRGFETLKIIQFRVGSIIVDFQITIANSINSSSLIDKSQELAKNLSASLSLQTTGVVVITVPSNSVKYNESAEITCTSENDLKVLPLWSLKRADQEIKITDGSNAHLTTVSNLSRVHLDSVDENWEGEYRCSFVQMSGNTTIYNNANKTMDVCLLPNIEASSDMAFPLCIQTSNVFQVNVNCQIKKSTENYTVTWPDGFIVGTTDYSNDVQTYKAQTVINCNEAVAKNVTNVTCTFKNECNQTQSQIFSINPIKATDSYCKAEGDWGNTKTGYTVQLKCRNQAGSRQRTCIKRDNKGVWEKEQNSCVPLLLKNVLDSAKIAGTGLGELQENVGNVFSGLQNVTATENINSPASINTSIQVFQTLTGILHNKTIENDTTINNMLNSSSNLLNNTNKDSWVTTTLGDSSKSLAENYLLSVELLVAKANITKNIIKPKLEVSTCISTECNTTVLNANVTLGSSDSGTVKTTGFQNISGYLPSKINDSDPNSIVVSATKEDATNIEIKINFPLINPRPRNVELVCVSWNNITSEWSKDGCTWGGASNEGQCICYHLSSFSILMSKRPLDVPGLTLMTYVGLSISVVSLFFCLIIEMIVWSDVVKTNTLYLRHTAHVNISLCLLVANCCFLGSSEPKNIAEIWCETFAVVKHFCYLAMFFWMLCLSTTLLHQSVFLFHKVSKKSYMRFSIIVGYVCPLLIVFITFLATKASGGSYFSKDTCWLVYGGLLKGTIFTFVIPVGIIVFVNTFSMLVVIMKLLDHHKSAETSAEKEKAAAKIVLRSVIFLTPIFGVTWGFGFAVLAMDLTEGIQALAVNYIFNLLNAFQGFFILLTTCVADQRTRESLLTRLKIKAPASVSDSTTKVDTTWKK